MEGLVNDIARQLRIKADAYEDFKDDTYLHCLLKGAADTIEVLTEQVVLLTTQTGIQACRSADMAAIRFRITELTRRANSLQALGEQLEAELRDARDQ